MTMYKPDHVMRSAILLCAAILTILAVSGARLEAEETGAGQRQNGADFAWDAVTDSDWNVDLGWMDERPGAVMIFERFHDDERGLYDQIIIQQSYTRTRILSEKGKAASMIEFQYAPSVDKIIDIRARTVLPNGRVFELTKDSILSKGEKIPKSGGSRRVSIPYPGMDTNCIVELFSLVKQVKIGSRPYTYRDRAVQKKVPLVSGDYVWYPATYSGPDASYTTLGYAKWCWSGATEDIKKSPGETRDDGSVRVRVTHVQGWYEEPMSLPDTATQAAIWRYYSEDLGSEGAWRRIAAEELASDLFRVSGEDKAVIHKYAERFRSHVGQIDIARAVYTWLQDSIINSSYYATPPAAFFKSLGMNVTKFKDSRRVVDGLTRRYASWMVLNALYYHLLKDLGVDVSPVYLPTRDARVLVPEAGFWQFSTFVMAVRDTAGGYIFCKPGDFGLPFGKLHWASEATDGLICSQRPIVARTSSSPPDMNAVVRTWRLSMRSDSLTDGVLSELHFGHKGRLFKVNLLLGLEDKAYAAVTDSVRQLLPGVQCRLIEAVADSANLSPVSFSYALTYRNDTHDSGGVRTVCPLSFAADTLNWFTAQKRRGEIVFQYAFHAVDTVSLELREPDVTMTVPRDSIVTTDAGWCSVAFRADSGRVTAVRDFVLSRPRYAAAEYLEVKRLFEARAALSRLAVSIQSRQ